jgi:hypothetical protein
MGAAAAQEGANWEQIGSGGSARGSKRGSKMGAAAAQEGAKAGAGCGFPVWFPRLLPLSAGVLTCAIAQERHAHFYMPLAVDRSLPVDVRLPHLSSRGLCLADSVLSQRSPSSQSVASIQVCYLSCHVFAIANGRFSQRSASVQSVASIPVCYLSCHVFAIANRHISQPSSSPDPAAAPYWVVPPWELYLPFVGWPRIRGSRGDGCCSGLGWLLAFVVFHAVSILSRVFANASVCACLVPL